MNLYIILLILTCFIHSISIHGFIELGYCGGIKQRRKALRMIVFGGWTSGIVDFIIISNLCYNYLSHSFIVSIILGLIFAIISYFIPLTIIEILHELKLTLR